MYYQLASTSYALSCRNTDKVECVREGQDDEDLEAKSWGEQKLKEAALPGEAKMKMKHAVPNI